MYKKNCLLLFQKNKITQPKQSVRSVKVQRCFPPFKRLLRGEAQQANIQAADGHHSHVCRGLRPICSLPTVDDNFQHFRVESQ